MIQLHSFAYTLDLTGLVAVATLFKQKCCNWL